MVNVEEWMDIQAMYRRGMSILEIARRTGRSRTTVRKYLKEPQKLPEYTKMSKRKSKLDPYEDGGLKPEPDSPEAVLLQCSTSPTCTCPIKDLSQSPALAGIFCYLTPT